MRVELEASQNSFLVDPRAVAPTGVLLVRVVNYGNRATESYHFRPGYVYALVAYPDSHGSTTSHWVVKETDSTHHTVTVAGINGPYTPCWDSALPATTDDVDLSNCGDKHDSAAVYKSGIGPFGSLDRFFALAVDALAGDPPIWKSCPSGCCTLPQAQ